MAPSESYDPRTWRDGDPLPPAPSARPIAPSSAKTGTPAAAPPVRSAWLGLALSAAVLTAGAIAAWTTRSDARPPAPDIAAPAS